MNDERKTEEKPKELALKKIINKGAVNRQNTLKLRKSLIKISRGNSPKCI